MASPPQDYDRVELVWPGKRTEVERVRLPFQVIERVNDVRRSREGQAPILTGAADLPDGWPEGWRNKLIWGDNKYVLASLLDEFAGKIDLIYIDPPFDSRTDYSMRVQVGSDTEDMEWQYVSSMLEMKSYRDTWARPGSYEQMLFDVIHGLRSLLRPTGSVVVHVDHHAAHHVRMILDEVFGPPRLVNEIIWYYKGGALTGIKSGLPRKHDNLFWYSAGNEFKFNAPRADKISSQMQSRWGNYADSEGVVRYRDIKHEPTQAKKTADKIRREVGRDPLDNDVAFQMRPSLVRSVWDDVPEVRQNPRYSESTGYQTQKPLKLLQRIIEMTTDPGDLVLDAFAGSGTTSIAAEGLGRRHIAVDLGRFAIQTTRKRLLEISDCRPFEVLNLGRYERRYWQGIETGQAVHDYYRFILELYRAQPIAGFAHLHGERAGRFVHVGATDAPVTLDELERTLEECTANGLTTVDVLGWEWEMGLNPAGKDELAAKHHVDVRLFHIPREVMDKRAADAGDVHFFELSVVELDADIDESAVEVELTGFLPAVDEYMREKVSGKVTKWSDWIDYWSIDFAFDGETFVNQWQAYRTRHEPKLALRSDPHEYEEPGEHRVVVKVIDIFGNDTTHELLVTIEL